MNDHPDISVVMANYNGAQHIGDAIRSLSRQTLQSWELIVVDDASTDDSVAIAHEVTAGDPRVTILQQPANRGPSAARNAALDVASGDWIAVFDSDDLMQPDRLEKLLRRAKADDAKIVVDNLMLFSAADPTLRPFLPERFSSTPRWIGLAEYITANSLRSRTHALGFLKPLISRDAIRGLNARYDEQLRIGEDYHFIVQLLAGGLRMRLAPDALYLYRKHSASISHRWGAKEICALLDAERRFAAGPIVFNDAEKAALIHRRNSLEAYLLFDRVVAAFKKGDLLRGALLGIFHPSVWTLLMEPIKTRLKRLGQFFKRPRPRNPAAQSSSADSSLGIRHRRARLPG